MSEQFCASAATDRLVPVAAVECALSADHLRALRNATACVFRFDGKHTTIEAHKSVDPGDGFGERTLSVDIPACDADIANYSGHSWIGSSGPRDEIVRASWGIPCTWTDDLLYTVTHYVLRAGDRLAPRFVVANDSENLERAGLSQDELILIVQRGPLDGHKRMLFLLDHEISPINSPARRIIRRHV